MAPRLIVNADDFGLTEGINRAVAELHQSRALTSATLMATGPALEDAVAVALANPALGVGCHIVLVDGLPVSPRGQIPSLLGADGKGFRRSFSEFAQAVLRRAVLEDELVREGVAQVRRLQDTGIAVTHLDTHKHVHMLPMVMRALLRVAGQCGIGAIRNPFEPGWAVALGHGTMVRRASVRMLARGFGRGFGMNVRRSGAVATTDGALGVAATGSLTVATLSAVLGALPGSGTWELVVHPGYDDAALAGVATRLRASREVEREVLLRCIPAVTLGPRGPELIHYGNL